MSKLLHRYTILLPLYKEKTVLDQLVKAIVNLKYPKSLLQVLILLEEDDEETIGLVFKKNLPNYFNVLIVESCGPKTKAKACNYGLKHATGEYLVIYDAEDIPAKDQLSKAAQIFDQCSDKSISCLQAKLTFYNHSENLLTKFCTLEYLIHFNFILPSFSRYEIPIPLGGTSNHFRTNALREISGWDEYNVTEDADITYRLCRKGYKIKMLDSYTSEETVLNIKPWIKQRSRWIKGHMITFLVQSRTIFSKNLYNKFKYMFSLYYFLGLPFFIFLLTIISILIWLLSMFNFIKIHADIIILLKYIFPLYFCCYFVVPLTLFYKKKTFSSAVYLFYPFYLLLYIIPACCAFFQLILNPYKWDKTTHGKSLVNTLKNLDEKTLY